MDNLETHEMQALDAAHHLHPFSVHHELANKGTRVITRAEGSTIWDSTGHRMIDGMAGLWCVNVGYGRSRLVDVAAEQMHKLPYYNSFFQSTSPPAIALAAKLAERLPQGFDRVFYGNSGSEANDTIVKTIWYYWNLQGKKTKKTIISRTLGYHGVGLGSGSLTGMSFMHEQFDMPFSRFAYIGDPYWFKVGENEDPESFGITAANWLDAKIRELGADNVAAFVAEPIQGAGGVLVPPASYWPRIQEICQEHDVLLVADEVICGFGRTGHWWGSDTYNIKADIMTLAKGLSSGYQPISAVALNSRVGDAIFSATDEFAHGVTYSGHPVACAVALENIKIMEEEALCTRGSGEIGEHFKDQLESLADHPIVGEIRIKGLVAAIQLAANETSRTMFDPKLKAGATCRDHSVRNGLVMRAVADSMVLSPPLVITKAEINEMTSIIAKSLDQTQADLVR